MHADQMIKFDFDDPMLLMKSWERKATARKLKWAPLDKNNTRAAFNYKQKLNMRDVLCVCVGGVTSHMKYDEDNIDITNKQLIPTQESGITTIIRPKKSTIFTILQF